MTDKEELEKAAEIEKSKVEEFDLWWKERKELENLKDIAFNKLKESDNKLCRLMGRKEGTQINYNEIVDYILKEGK